jgi:import inner membrane translocase subunit TIM9
MATQQVSIDQLDKDQIKSFQDFLLSYNKLSETCFVDCIGDFTSRTIKDSEVSILICQFIRTTVFFHS